MQEIFVTTISDLTLGILMWTKSLCHYPIMFGCNPQGLLPQKLTICGQIMLLNNPSHKTNIIYKPQILEHTTQTSA
jgi:hypothetical protein